MVKEMTQAVNDSVRYLFKKKKKKAHLLNTCQVDNGPTSWSVGKMLCVLGTTQNLPPEPSKGKEQNKTTKRIIHIEKGKKEEQKKRHQHHVKRGNVYVCMHVCMHVCQC